MATQPQPETVKKCYTCLYRAYASTLGVTYICEICGDRWARFYPSDGRR